MRLPSEDARCLPSEGQMLIGPSCACLQKTKTSLAVGPIMVGFFLFVVVGSGERSLHAESLPTAQGRVLQAYPPSLPPSVNALAAKAFAQREPCSASDFKMIPITVWVRCLAPLRLQLSFKSSGQPPVEAASEG